MLSDRQIQSAMKRCTAQVTLNDGNSGHGTGSLVLVVNRRQNGVSAHWVGRWWTDGRQRKKTLGRYPDVTLQQARDLFGDQVRSVLAAGLNPKAQAVAHQRATVSRLFTEYCDRMVADDKSSAGEVRRCLKYASDHFGQDRPAGEIHPSDVSAYLASIYNRGAAVAADRVRSYLSAAFNYGMKASHDYRSEQRQDWGIAANPVTAVRKHASASKPRDRALSAAEIRTFWHGMDGGGFAIETRAALRLMICCGQRLRETLRIEAHEIDLEAGLWTMPADKTKVGRFQHVVPLPSSAVAVLRELMQLRPSGRLIPITEAAVSRSVARWLRGGHMDAFQPRDLRRTWKSRAADAGVDRFTRDLIQQHAMGDTGSRHYDRADYLPKMREAMAKWDVWLQSANG